MTENDVIRLIKEYGITETEVKRIIANQGRAVEVTPALSADELDTSTTTMPLVELDPTTGKPRRFIRAALSVFTDPIHAAQDDAEAVVKDATAAVAEARKQAAAAEQQAAAAGQKASEAQQQAAEARKQAAAAQAWAEHADLSWSDMTDAEKEALRASLLSGVVFASVSDGQQAINELK